MKERYMAEPIKKTTARNHELERWPDKRQNKRCHSGTYSDFGRHKLNLKKFPKKALQIIPYIVKYTM